MQWEAMVAAMLMLPSRATGVATTSACSIARTAASVNSSGLPGPTPTSVRPAGAVGLMMDSGTVLREPGDESSQHLSRPW